MAFVNHVCPTCGNTTVSQVCDNCGQPATDAAMRVQAPAKALLIICTACQQLPLALAGVAPRDTTTA